MGEEYAYGLVFIAATIISAICDMALSSAGYAFCRMYSCFTTAATASSCAVPCSPCATEMGTVIGDTDMHNPGYACAPLNGARRRPRVFIEPRQENTPSSATEGLSDKDER
jgi:hypothetical protein